MFIIISIISLSFILFTSIYELYFFYKAPFLNNCDDIKPLKTSLTVIIPTYNEEKNIENCLTALSKIKVPSKEFQILIIDDSSTDETITIAQKCKEKLFKDKLSLEIIPAGERPNDKNWVGKNWPCYVGSKKVNSKFILFIDADVVIEKNCIANALAKSFDDNVDLLSLAPKVNCNCLAEWMVQPIMTSLLMLGFPISDTNDPKSKTAFAAGPFMLFRRESYELIGGHKETYNEIVEDLALAKKIKAKDLKLSFLVAIDNISLNMYDNFNSLIEGWSKNWYLGLDKNIFISIVASIFVFTIYTIPWLIFLSELYKLLFNNYLFLNINNIILSFTGLIIYWIKRYYLYKTYNISYKLWFLNGLGGLIVIYISFLSIYKTSTGSNWTWKGRKLSN